MTDQAAEFTPSRDRAVVLDQRMRTRLADSLSYVFVEIGDELEIDPNAADELDRRIRSGTQHPQLFGAYYDLVLALENEERGRATSLAREILARAESGRMRIAAIQDRSASDAERYRRLFMGESRAHADDPDDAQLSQCLARIEAAFALLDAGFPAMADEVRALLREIVLATGPEDPKAPTFDGASSYMLWGAILLNTRGQTSVLDTAQALAHESGHNLLFGFCTDGPLVENPDDELFPSPLRTDLRPMDGIVHATYVVARMHQTLIHLLDAGVLESGQRSAARADLELHARNFEAGDRTIREGARLTRTGIAAMDAARDYMASAHRLEIAHA